MVLNNTCKCMQTLRRNIHGLVYIPTHIHICMYTYTRIHAYTYIWIHIHTHTYPKLCKTSSVGRSAGLSILRSSVRFRQKLKNKTVNSNLQGFEVHRPSSKGTKLLLQVIKAIINQYMDTCTYTYAQACTYTYIHIHMPMHTYIYIYICTFIAYEHPVESVKQMCTLMFTTSV